jgi:gliding motility-associated-like protein
VDLECGAGALAVTLSCIKSHTIMKRALTKSFAAALLFSFVYSAAPAQDSNSAAAVKYRITAYKKGDNSILSQSNIAEVTPPVNLYIPNAFTPNGDGLNDMFGAAGQGISEFSMQVFNRWGNLIFESNDIRKQWDGTYKGEKAELGVYVYKVSAKGPKSYEIRKTGSITLVL